MRNIAICKIENFNYVVSLETMKSGRYQHRFLTTSIVNFDETAELFFFFYFDTGPVISQSAEQHLVKNI